jgi:oxygen-independent coproporphyrinogen-3 oxidase
VDEAYLTATRQAGFNRLSIGTQSLHDGELKLLGRAHTADDFRATVKMARDAGFENVSADLMYGIPGQSRESFAESVRGICALGVQHVSAYALKIEQGTPFYKMRHKLDLPDEDTVADMYEDCVAILAEHGLARYEISNFARAGYESRHNLKYWEYGEYLGLGAAAHSFLGGKRFAYDDAHAYMSGAPVVNVYEDANAQSAQDEYVMVGLRLEKGIDKAAFAARFGREFDAVYGARLAPYVRAGFVQNSPERCHFTTKGFMVSNTILADILDFD